MAKNEATSQVASAPPKSSERADKSVTLTDDERKDLDECVAKAANSWLVQKILSTVVVQHKLKIDLKQFSKDPRQIPNELKKKLALAMSGNGDRAAEQELVVAILKGLEEEFKKRIVGQDELMRMLMICLVLNEHALLEGLPGVGKTDIVKWVASVCGLPFSRIQFIPDMLPSDLIGKDHINILLLEQKKEGAVQWRSGPVFGSILLADEINRAPSKVQAALLEAMGERQVTPFGQLSQPVLSPLHQAAFRTWKQAAGLLGATFPIAGDSDSLKDFAQFTVFATMNPIEQEGTYPLSEAQTDRFCFKIIVPYPSRVHYREISRVVLDSRGPIRPIETNLSVEKCEAYFRENPDAAILALLPVYFFLKCRAFVLPVKIENPESPQRERTALFPEITGHSLYERLVNSSESSAEGNLLQKIHDVVYMTNARGGQSGEGSTTAGWYDREQLEMRAFIANPPDSVGDPGRKNALREILQQNHCRYVKAGASPRGFLKLIPAVLCHSFVHGDPSSVHERDIRGVIDNTLRHRVHMDVHARLGGVTAEDVIQKVCQIRLS
jgi:MoxR-like ATPase